KKVINENHTQETTEKVKKKHGENINPVSPNEEIKENTSHREEEMPTSEMDAEKKQRMAKKRKREDSECSKDFIRIDDTRNA
ncbi:hypothetical protein, partial [Staphylococcus aureus]|uniref:hypothetical protein n=1 Tax=Staphylococcus aureus TaxID=1280 RepID=UPI0038B3E938